MRPTTAADLDRVLAIEAGADTIEWLCDTGRSWHERVLADPDQEHLVAEYDGAVVGFGVLVGRRSGAGVVELRRMAMSSAHRGGGLGRGLLRELVGRARDHFGARRVWLDVKAHNTRARRLYETEGFVRYETRVGVIAEPDGSTSDLVLMRRELEPGIS
jgi:diamine N-acetyltransferase